MLNVEKMKRLLARFPISFSRVKATNNIQQKALKKLNDTETESRHSTSWSNQ